MKSNMHRHHSLIHALVKVRNCLICTDAYSTMSLHLYPIMCFDCYRIPLVCADCALVRTSTEGEATTAVQDISTGTSHDIT